MKIVQNKPKTGTVTYQVMGQIRPIASQSSVVKQRPRMSFMGSQTILWCGADRRTESRFERFFQRQSFLYSLIKFCVRHILGSCPLRKSQGFPFVSNFYSNSSVSCLSKSIFPLAIIRSIWSIVVDALKSRAFWRVSHVFMERCDIEPSIAHSNPSSSVINESRIIIILTSANHVPPNVIELAIGLNYAVSCMDLKGSTSARFTVSGTQRSDGYRNIFSAGTSAQPSGFTLRRGNHANRGELPVNLSRLYSFVAEFFRNPMSVSHDYIVSCFSIINKGSCSGH